MNRVQQIQAFVTMETFNLSEQDCIDIATKAIRWQNMSDSELRLRAGELTADEILTIRAVLRQITGVYE